MKKKPFILSMIIGLLMIAFSSMSNETAIAKSESSSKFKRNSNGEIIHEVQKDETVKDIAISYGVPMDDLLAKNDKTTKTVKTGDVLVMPKTLTSQEKNLMARLVEAEAKGEPYKGKVAVANVVLNRVESSKFPDTVTEVINAKGQFSPVSNGSIKKPASTDSKKAVNEAIALQENAMDATFFYNPKKTNDKWIKSLKVIAKIGNHNFSVS